MQQGHPDLVAEANGYLRELIDRIVLTPDATAPHGLAIELRVPLGGLLGGLHEEGDVA
jgi:hypothetical protein